MGKELRLFWFDHNHKRVQSGKPCGSPTKAKVSRIEILVDRTNQILFVALRLLAPFSLCVLMTLSFQISLFFLGIAVCLFVFL